MEKNRYLNSSHVANSLEAKKRRMAFAAAFAVLLRTRMVNGKDIKGIQYQAAAAAGFGEESWSDEARYQTQRTMSARLMKEKVVRDELIRLGLVYNERKKAWHDPLLCTNDR